MQYHTLKTYKYMHHLNISQLNKKYHQELQSSMAQCTNLEYFIKGFTFPLFYIKSPKIQMMQNIIYQNSINIMQIISQLSRYAQKQFFIGNLQREIQMTNKIEGLHITTKEITKAITDATNNVHPIIHFQPFAKMYLLINKRKKLQIHYLIDIRNIYNQLFKTIFPKNVYPQHTLFRNNFIRIGNQYQTSYIPKAKEKDFIPNLKEWIKFINNDNISPLIKACIAHFFFESIHPFNDGNGRTGRYILCTYLANKIDKYTAISFSQTINQNEKLYYKSFEYLNNPLMYGDVTIFIINMFKIIINSQTRIIKDLNHRIQDYHNIKEHINVIKLAPISRKIIGFLLKQQLFNLVTKTSTITQVQKEIPIKISRYLIRKYIKKLINKNIVQEIGKNPLTFRIKTQYIYQNI